MTDRGREKKPELFLSLIGWLLTDFLTLHDYMSKWKLKHTYWPRKEGKLGTRIQPTSTSVVEDSSSSFVLLMAEIFRGGGSALVVDPPLVTTSLNIG